MRVGAYELRNPYTAFIFANALYNARRMLAPVSEMSLTSRFE